MYLDHQPVLIGEFVEVGPLQDDALALDGALVAIDRRQGSVIGTSRFWHVTDTSAVEIGRTFLTRPPWDGPWNSEMKHLMLDHAFGSVTVVVFRIHSLDLRSQRVAEELGAVRAGTETRRRPRSWPELPLPARSRSMGDTALVIGPVTSDLKAARLREMGFDLGGVSCNRRRVGRGCVVRRRPDGERVVLKWFLDETIVNRYAGTLAREPRERRSTDLATNNNASATMAEQQRSWDVRMPTRSSTSVITPSSGCESSMSCATPSRR